MSNTDRNKIAEYDAVMLKNYNYCVELSQYAINSIGSGIQGYLKESVLHNGVEYLKARDKKSIELDSRLTPMDKDQRIINSDAIYDLLEAKAKDFLRRNGKLL